MIKHGLIQTNGIVWSAVECILANTNYVWHRALSTSLTNLLWEISRVIQSLVRMLFFCVSITKHCMRRRDCRVTVPLPFAVKFLFQPWHRQVTQSSKKKNERKNVFKTQSLLDHRGSHDVLLRSFSNHDGDGSENGTKQCLCTLVFTFWYIS